MDLAAHDATVATAFYTRLFDWSARDRRIGPSRLVELCRDGQAVASIYQLDRRQIEAGVPSHWTPYVAVEDLSRSRERVARLGGRVLVEEFRAPGVARVALVLDPLGAALGLWETVDDSPDPRSTAAAEGNDRRHHRTHGG